MITSPYVAPADRPATDLFLRMLSNIGNFTRQAPRMMPIPSTFAKRLEKHGPLRKGNESRHSVGVTKGSSLLSHAHSERDVIRGTSDGFMVACVMMSDTATESNPKKRIRQVMYLLFHILPTDETGYVNF
mmetsp:Transcript_70044/g.104223  ORF Transcript_70044/g.104223 Transcript_70044/m.104223 type:complete len:130 (-) Transcript_70044:38-427(-)